MQPHDVLDVFEKLFTAAEHPGIVKVEQHHGRSAGGYDGVNVYWSFEGHTFLWINHEKASPQECPPPHLATNLRVVDYLLLLALGLCDAARPAPFASWAPAAYPGVAVSPGGLVVKAADGSTFNLRITHSSGANGDPKEDPFPDYRIPQGVQI